MLGIAGRLTATAKPRARAASRPRCELSCCQADLSARHDALGIAAHPTAAAREDFPERSAETAPDSDAAIRKSPRPSLASGFSFRTSAPYCGQLETVSTALGYGFPGTFPVPSAQSCGRSCAFDVVDCTGLCPISLGTSARRRLNAFACSPWQRTLASADVGKILSGPRRTSRLPLVHSSQVALKYCHMHQRVV